MLSVFLVKIFSIFGIEPLRNSRAQPILRMCSHAPSKGSLQGATEDRSNGWWDRSQYGRVLRIQRAGSVGNTEESIGLGALQPTCKSLFKNAHVFCYCFLTQPYTLLQCACIPPSMVLELHDC